MGGKKTDQSINKRLKANVVQKLCLQHFIPSDIIHNQPSFCPFWYSFPPFSFFQLPIERSNVCMIVRTCMTPSQNQHTTNIKQSYKKNSNILDSRQRLQTIFYTL